MTFRIKVLPVDNWLNVVYGMVMAYAITKARLMDISVVISRFAAWLLTVGFLGSIYVGLVWFYRAYITYVIDVPFLIWTMAYGILVGEIFQRIRLFFQTSADKLFIRGSYNYYKELSDASSKVGRILELSNILKVLYDTFHDVVEIANPRIFLPENFADPSKPSERYVVYDKKTHQPQVAGQEIKIDSDLVRELVAKREPLLDGKELQAALIVPCMVEDRLIAIFVLGHKMSEDPYTDEDLRLLKVLANQVAITIDHTRSYEKIKTDLEVAEKQLERSQRLASIGTLTAGVTHEIRNPLTVIRSETERLPNAPRDQNYLNQYKDLMLKHIDRISGIVQRMLGLAKEKPKVEMDIDLNDLISNTLACFAISKIKVVEDYQPIKIIKGNPDELQEVFVNLIQNSIEAMTDDGTLTLRTFVENGRVAVEVADTGKGIPPEIREKIFDPFYSTRHEGTGLGLAIVYRIIREHGGDIVLTSEVGKGTTFKLLF